MRKGVTLFLILILLIYSGYQYFNKENQTTVKVGTWKTAQTIQPFFYNQYIDGTYKIEVLPFTNPGDQKTALLAGDLDLCGTTLVQAIISASKGEPVVIVSGLCNKCSAFVVGNDSGIQSVKDLKGKTIAYVPGTMHHILLLESLKRAGLDPDKDVLLKRIDFFDMGQALAQGEVDAFCSGEPYPSLAVSNSYGRILEYPYYEEDIGYINAGMLTTHEKIKNEREKIQKLVTAHVKATEYLTNNKDAWLNKAAEFGTVKEVLLIAEDNMELAWDIDQKYINQARKLAERMKEIGVISEVPDIDSLFDLSFVNQARKELNK
ncbi:ABC transporter substrate-binding protein [Pelotomaculum propionicicum]|uniref:Putative aliphatic sulfonates-binding protein n=1 Tax=Pelotomaculum propionicicum TaxID=258475 RepID=A0A4Y7RWC4_9FIRM|nr:ABC transporter substrate-binding protein [Pelotomaculum propionicicum]NLI11726.1 ABC transporter substrate-binding protein [Peptococcaceae bacterium]TEB12982.1 putative aliphatic sulfonates-binding protein [Pelotomaculum propionicicum]